MPKPCKREVVAQVEREGDVGRARGLDAGLGLGGLLGLRQGFSVLAAERTTTSEPSVGAPASGRMMVARSVVSLPRSESWPFCSRACTLPEMLTCRSARTSTCRARASALKSMAMPEPAPPLPFSASAQETKPVPVSVPPLFGGA